ncbi:MAG: class I mannose-6-phosphate isomerase [Phycisphaerales bacterium]|nr:class I mannose-6-phosphate isomerase [Phycisphaerales bacterium]
MHFPPLTFKPILKPRAWGGDSLRDFGKAIDGDTPTGESWELADLPDSIPDGRSVVSGGPFDGRTLRSLIEEDPTGILGRAQPGPDGGFPLLIKILDARENLSVQLHPSAAYADTHEDAYLKTEAWLILDADPGALVYAGIEEAVDHDRFREALASGNVRELLVATEVTAGDCVFLESGLCHALGEGLVAAEVQTPSDTTFRVWDWNRNDPNRKLHVEEALECVRLGSGQASKWPRITRRSEATSLAHDGLEVTTLVDCDRFRMERFEPAAGRDDSTSFTFPTNGMPHVFMSCSGTASLTANGASIQLPRGTTALLPAAAGSAEITLEVRDNQRCELLHAIPPDPLAETLA